MAQIITAKDAFPASISNTVIQKDSHGSPVMITSGGDLTIKGTFSGDIEIESGGLLTVQGQLMGRVTIQKGGDFKIEGCSQGNVMNRGTMTIEGKLEGDCDNYGEYELIGKHDGKALNLKNGSNSFIKGKGKIDVFSELGAKLEVAPEASLTSSSGNQNEAIENAGAIAIGGGNVAHSLRSTGSVIFTGNSIFK